MKKTCIVGASGYTGCELIKIISRHPSFSLETCYVSDGSQYADKTASEVHTELGGICDMPLIQLNPNRLSKIKDTYDLVFLATPHEFSHDHMPAMLGGNAKVFDLSGAYRLQDTDIFSQYYGFAHTQQDTLSQAVYGLAEHNSKAIATAACIAVPGCYPTASLLALKPLTDNDLIAPGHIPVINATSGVSGAGKKASMTNSFCEVSLQAYGVLSHRHTPEIEAHAQSSVIFTPHLGAFKRGILATLTAFVKQGVSADDISAAFEKAYANAPLVRMKNTMPKIDHVAHTPFCDIAFAYDEHKQCVVVSSAIDNLLKGASSQAIQCANIVTGIDQTVGLV